MMTSAATSEADNVSAAASASASAATATTSTDIEMASLKQRLESFICVLCEAKEHARVSLLATEKGKSKFAVGNAEKHFNKRHKEIDHKKPFTGKFRPSLSNSLTVTGMWTKKKAAEEPLTDYAIKKAAYFLCLAEATEEEIELVVHHLQKLCASRLLPYSFVDWPELRELVEVCVALPAKKVSNRLSENLVQSFIPYRSLCHIVLASPKNSTSHTKKFKSV